MAPELLIPTKFGLLKGIPSKEADIYALGMTIYQVLTGKLPFLQRRKARVIHAVMLGERPAKPENAEEIGMTDVVWDLLRGCWGEERAARPIVTEVLKKFYEITSGGGTSDPTLAESPGRNSITPLNSSSTSLSCKRYPLHPLFRSFSGD